MVASKKDSEVNKPEVKKKEVRMKLSFEVVLVIIILALLFQFIPLGKGTNVKISESSDANRILEVGNTEDGRFTRIEKDIIGSKLLEHKEITKYPKLPGKVLLFDKTKFVEGEIKKYENGTEYYLMFEYLGVSTYNQFAEFYRNVVEKDGWVMNLELNGVNGSKTVFEDDNVEVRSVTFRRKHDETGEIYIREKVRIFELNK